MANLELKAENGFFIIREKIGNVLNDLGTMIDKNQISPEAAKWLLDELSKTVEICRDYENIAGEDIEKPRSISF